jgi:hypothetical protein
MKSFRNILAHAKPQQVSEIHEIPENVTERLVPFPGGKKTIMSYSSVENAERFMGTAQELELMWIHAITNLKIEVDKVGAPVYEVIDAGEKG